MLIQPPALVIEENRGALHRDVRLLNLLADEVTPHADFNLAQTLPTAHRLPERFFAVHADHKSYQKYLFQEKLSSKKKFSDANEEKEQDTMKVE